MFIRILPGLATSMFLGLALCVAPSVSAPTHRDRGGRAESRPWLDVPEPGFHATNRNSYWRPNHSGSKEFTPSRPSMPSVEPIRPESLAHPPMAPLQRIVSGKERRADSSALPAIQEMSPSGLEIAHEAPAVSSTQGFASLRYPDGGGYYVESPEKGMYLSAEGGFFSARQKVKSAGTQYSHYDHDGGRVRLALKYDWSIDSTVGLSIDRLDHRIKSLREDDPRRNDLTGYVFNAHYEGAVMGKFPVDIGLFYGRVDNKGKGTAGGLSWREEKHRSDLYGLSGMFGVPLETIEEIKILPEIGFTYTKLKSKAYTVNWETTRFNVAKMNSTSMTIPFRTEVKRDFLRCWGFFRPRLSVGYIAELDDDATGVRVLNASGGGMVTGIDYGNRELAVQYDKSEKSFFEFGVGLDIQTNGGWEISADYIRSLAKKYANDTFRLELARCF